MAVEEPACVEPDSQQGNNDEELTSLTWLQDTDLLKDFGLEEEEEEEVEHVEEVEAQEQQQHPQLDNEEEEEEDCFEDVDEGGMGPGGGGEQNVAPPLSPYDPSLHPRSKPPFSFSCLIFMAIEDSPSKALPVKDIYAWITQHFPYFQTAPTGWKNSVRHNLSLSKCFRKVDKEKGQSVGKGSLWCIDPEFRPNLLQALQKAPSMANLEFSHFFHSSSSATHHHRNGKMESEIKPCLLVSSQEAIQIPSPELFPFLSRRLASTMKDPEVDAAATMLTLKNGPNHPALSEESENNTLQSNQKFGRKRLRIKYTAPLAKRGKFSQKPVVITTSPSEDHTYSACTDGEPKERNNNNVEEEGANALMNLAEIASKRLLRKVNNIS